MTNKKITSLEQLNALTDSLVDDIINLSDSEFLEEAKEQFDNPEQEAERLRNIVNNAVLKASKRKLSDAKLKVNEHKKQAYRNNVINVPITQKRAAIKRLAANNPEFQEKLTLAARKGEGIETDNDIEGCFEDMFELGLIDEQGNLK